jgi:hypothetical protein
MGESGLDSEEVKLTVYRITGRQLIFTVNSSVCEECDLAVAAANEAAREVVAEGIDVEVDVRPWLNNLFRALFRGAYHPPAVLVDGKLVSQGIVPTVEGLKVAIRAAMDRRAEFGHDDARRIDRQARWSRTRQSCSQPLTFFDRSKGRLS